MSEQFIEITLRVPESAAVCAQCGSPTTDIDVFGDGHMQFDCHNCRQCWLCCRYYPRAQMRLYDAGLNLREQTGEITAYESFRCVRCIAKLHVERKLAAAKRAETRRRNAASKRRRKP